MQIKDKMKEGNGKIAPTFIKNITKDDVYIHPKLVRDLEDILVTLRNMDDFGDEMGDRNYIFSGPAGCGKTLILQYIAHELNFPIYDGKNIFNAQHIANAFQQLRDQAQTTPLILMINEIDKFSSRDDVVDPAQSQTLNQLLDEMDGLDKNSKMYIFGTTNRPNKIDNALRRGKRFSKEVYFMPPDKDGRLAILKIHAIGKNEKNKKEGGHKFEVNEKDLEEVAKVTFGYTGADLVCILNAAFTSAKRDKRNKVEYKDLEYALTKTKPSALKDMPFKEPNKKFKDMGGYEGHKEVLKRIVANSDGSNILFYGPKGTGKTDFAEAMAGEYGFNLIMISGSAPEDKWVGETEKILDKYFERAKQLAPCILLFDEMDSLVERKGLISHKGGWTGLLQSKLSKPIEGVYVIGTVNRPDRIGDAFTDRFVHRLFFGMPSKEEQEAIWRLYLPNEFDVKKLVDINDKLSCRDISYAHQRVKDWGLENTFEVYDHLIKNIQGVDTAVFDEIRLKYRDSVTDYNEVKAFLGAKK
ncbi:MAG TPA: AAA family ATPase [Candidatus Nanoarchaeia archaeon]|nr:AAA family ATPase [Candidatus Nanoarchaeia archaeon]